MPKTRQKPRRAKRQTHRQHSAPRSKHAVTLTVILRAREGQEALLEAELRALIAPTRRETGCLAYVLHGALESPGTFLLHEEWASREHHARHQQTPHFLRWDARKDALLASRNGTFWERLA